MALFAAPQEDGARRVRVDFVEEAAALTGQAMGVLRSDATAMVPGQELQTGLPGRAEVVLGPDVFLRLDDDSAIQIITLLRTNTRVELRRGRATVEVDRINKEDHISVLSRGVETVLLKKGVYGFSADPPFLMVYDGKAAVQKPGHQIRVESGKGVSLLAESGWEPQSADTDPTFSLYIWGKIRSQSTSEGGDAPGQRIIAIPSGYGNSEVLAPFLPGPWNLYNPFDLQYYLRYFYAAPHVYPPSGGFAERPEEPDTLTAVHGGFRGSGGTVRPAAPVPFNMPGIPFGHR